MSEVQADQTPTLTSAEWVSGSQQAYRLFGGGVDVVAERQYEHAPETSSFESGINWDGARRLASYVPLGTTAPTHVDMRPTNRGWAFRASHEGLELSRLASLTRALLHTDPRLDPIMRSAHVYDRRNRSDSNKTRLINKFNDYIIDETIGTVVVSKPPEVATGYHPFHHIGVTEIAQLWRGPEMQNISQLGFAASGVLLLAKNRHMKNMFERQFARGIRPNLRKLYVAKVDGDVEAEQLVQCYLQGGTNGRMIANGDGVGDFVKTTLTPLERIATEDGNRHTIVGVETLTNRTHQIRASLALTGKPIVGDPLYSAKQGSLGRLYLHAQTLVFTDPQSGGHARVDAPLPVTEFLPGVSDEARTRVVTAVDNFIDETLRERPRDY